MRKFAVITGVAFGTLLAIIWIVSGIVVMFNRNRVAIVQAQANIEQARAMQETAIAAQEAAHAAQIASMGQTAISAFNVLLFGVVLAVIIAFAAVFMYLRFFRGAPEQAVGRTHIPPASSWQHPPEMDPHQALLQQMTQMMLLEMLQRQMERLPQSLEENPDA